MTQRAGELLREEIDMLGAVRRSEIETARMELVDLARTLSQILESHAKRYRKHGLVFSKSSYDKLQSYNWPGNVRELKNTLEQAVLLCNSDSIQPEHLMIQGQNAIPVSSSLPSDAYVSMNLKENEIGLIKSALDQTKGNMSKAANLLGLSRDTLRYRLSKYSIEVD